jgi:hypothetical protein
MSTTTTAQPKPKAPTAKVRREIVAKRADGVTLAELRKQYPALTSEQIRDVLAAAEQPASAQGYSGSGETVGERQPEPQPKRTRAKAQPAEPKPATNGGTTDKKRQVQAAKAPAAKVERKAIDGKLAQRAVTMRAKLDDRGRPTSWAKVGYALKLVPEGAPKSQAGDAARRAYRQVKGENAPTGPSDY